MRLRMVHHTDAATLETHIHRFTHPDAQVYTDERNGYNHIQRSHETVNHGQGEYARDADGYGVREVHVNTTEGMWTDLRNFLRPFKCVHKKYLAGYIAMAEFRRNLKRILPVFIASIVKVHTSSP